MPRNFPLILIAIFLISACAGEETNRTDEPDLRLASLSLASGKLHPEFNPSVREYAAFVPRLHETATLSAVAADPLALVSYDPLPTVELASNSNLITVSVTLPNHPLTNSYRIWIDRVPADGADLAFLGTSAAGLEPAFDPALPSYSITAYVSNAVPASFLNAAPRHPLATLACTPELSSALSTGSNRITIQVTAPDRTTRREYHVSLSLIGAPLVSARVGTLRYIPAGSFQRDAVLANISAVSAFYMGEKEITRAQFSNVMGFDPSDPTKSLGTADPVQNVAWFEAVEFCNRLSELEGLQNAYIIQNRMPATGYPITAANVYKQQGADGYRLPMEMEWMWAAIGARMHDRPFTVNRTGRAKGFSGNADAGTISDHSWTFSNSNGTTHPAGTRKANELGLYDMSGNVWEWCHDLWQETLSMPSGKLTDYQGPVSGSGRVGHGGGYDGDDPAHYAPAYRTWGSSAVRYPNVGFRIVRP